MGRHTPQELFPQLNTLFYELMPQEHLVKLLVAELFLSTITIMGLEFVLLFTPLGRTFLFLPGYRLLFLCLGEIIISLYILGQKW